MYVDYIWMMILFVININNKNKIENNKYINKKYKFIDIYQETYDNGNNHIRNIK